MANIVTTGGWHAVEQLGEGDIPTVTGLSAVSYGAGPFRYVEVTFQNVAVPLADEAAVVAYGGLKFFDFAEGAVCIVGAVANFNVTKTSAGVNADWDGDFGVGTATASNNATLTGTEQNVIPSTATPQAVSGATTAKGVLTTMAILDGTTTPVDLYVNFLVDDTDHNVAGTACNLILNGTLSFAYIWQGNH